MNRRQVLGTKADAERDGGKVPPRWPSAAGRPRPGARPGLGPLLPARLQGGEAQAEGRSWGGDDEDDEDDSGHEESRQRIPTNKLTNFTSAGRTVWTPGRLCRLDYLG